MFLPRTTHPPDLQLIVFGKVPPSFTHYRSKNKYSSQNKNNFRPAVNGATSTLRRIVGLTEERSHDSLALNKLNKESCVFHYAPRQCIHTPHSRSTLMKQNILPRPIDSHSQTFHHGRPGVYPVLAPDLGENQAQAGCAPLQEAEKLILIITMLLAQHRGVNARNALDELEGTWGLSSRVWKERYLQHMEFIDAQVHAAFDASEAKKLTPARSKVQSCSSRDPRRRPVASSPIPKTGDAPMGTKV
ncbi:hypothetical protein C8R43DRAFT_943200 [Mycena crocata]|nr:hypothetical protein C8R43DRAFT_943200 [Mycena crocata]